MKAFLFLIFLLFFSLSIFGNGVGNYQEKEANGFVFEFGIEPNFVIEKQKIPMSISVHEKQSGKAIETENFWIRISKGEEIVFSSTDLKTKATGPIMFVYAFPEEGLYAIDFGFNDGQGKQVSAGFEVSVLASIGNDNQFVQLLTTGILIFVVGMAIGFIAKGFWKNEKKFS